MQVLYQFPPKVLEAYSKFISERKRCQLFQAVFQLAGTSNGEVRGI